MNWRRRYYEEGYLRRWNLPAFDETDRIEARAFLSLARCSPPARVLDAGCGHGRYAVALAHEGYDVSGMDESWSLLRRALSQAQDAGPRVGWVRGDLRFPPFRPGFDAVLMKDAFGYFDRAGEDLGCLRALRGLLVPGGHIVLRNPNAEWLRIHWEERLVEEEADRSVAIRNRRDGQWLIQDLTITDSEGESSYTRRQLIYDLGQLTDLLQSAGFEDLRHYADTRGNPVGPDSFHLYTVGRRPVADQNRGKV